MKSPSRRARRMDRHHKIRRQPVLNLVSLMDIFTILVFFLLVSSSSSQQLPNTKDLKLPESVSNKAPEETLIITLTPENLLVQGRKLVDVENILQSEQKIIPELKEELLFHAQKSRVVQLEGASDGNKPSGRAVTIMGDENIPYAVVSKIMATCRDVDYTQIAFAARQKARESQQ